MSDTIPVQEVRRVLNRVMLHSSSEMNRWNDAIKARLDESDPLLTTTQYAHLIQHSAEWHTALLIAAELKIKLDE
jgi:hypothetical protein